MDAKVQQKLNDVRTPDGVPLPHNGVAALWRRVERFQLINQEIRTIERQRLLCLQRDLNSKSNAVVSVLVRTIALGVEIVEQLVHEILSRNLRGRKTVACYAGVNRAKGSLHERHSW
jgi:transposase